MLDKQLNNSQHSKENLRRKCVNIRRISDKQNRYFLSDPLFFIFHIADIYIFMNHTYFNIVVWFVRQKRTIL